MSNQDQMKSPCRHVLFLFCLFCLTWSATALAGPLQYIGEKQTHTIRENDVFIRIARENNLGFVELRSANPDVDPWYPEPGTEIILPKRHLLPDAPHKGLVVNLAEMRLYVFDDSENPVASYPLGIGRDGLSTPVGSTKIVRKKEEPVWYPTERMRKEDPALPRVVRSGPDNPLGTHALYLGWHQFLIHGTNEPWGIGRRVSSGCMRMYPEDIVELYNRTAVGTDVTVVDQPLKLAWIDNTLFLEAHPTQQQALKIEEEGKKYVYDVPDGFLNRLEKEFQKKTQGTDGLYKPDWISIREALIERSGVPVAISLKTDNPEVH